MQQRDPVLVASLPGGALYRLLSKVGDMEQSFMDWHARMCARWPTAFENARRRWAKLYARRMCDYKGYTFRKDANHYLDDKVPLAAYFRTETIGPGPYLPAPIWLNRLARETLDPAAPIPMTKRSSYWTRFRTFCPDPNRSTPAEAHCIMDRAWLAQARTDYLRIPLERPGTFRLVRQHIIRLTLHPSKADDPVFDRLVTPDSISPSTRTLRDRAAILAASDGQDVLNLARAILRDFDTAQGRWIDGPLYRAAILPILVMHANNRIKATGSVREAAYELIARPESFIPEKETLWRMDTAEFGLRDLRKRPPLTLINFNRILCGCLWLVAVSGTPEDVQLLSTLAKNFQRDDRIFEFNRIIRALGLTADRDAINEQIALRQKTRHSLMLGQINAALADSARKSGISITELEERSAYTHGLDSHHERAVPLPNGLTATLSLKPNGSGTVTLFSADGTELRPVPPAIRAELKTIRAYEKLREEARALTKEMQAHRLRLERSWITQERWTAERFRTNYLAHPVLSWLAHRQIWTLTAPDGTQRTILFPNGTPVAPDGTPTAPLRDDETVTLWHPLDADTALVNQWRDTLESIALIQPIRQAWRETYVLTDAERATSPVSLRYAKQVLRQAQSVELGRQRGWRVRILSMHMPSSEGDPTSLTIPSAGLHAEIWTAGVDGQAAFHHGTFTHILTERVQFRSVTDKGSWRHDGGKKLAIGKDTVPLENVPPLIFSEVMRDLDLFVSVASIGLEVTYLDGAEGRSIGEWRRLSDLAMWKQDETTSLAGRARIRYETLERVLPRLTIADRLELIDTHVHVRGVLHSYRIHIGTGNIFLDPDRRYICIVPDARKKKSSIALPFDDDQTLSVILSKLFLLAADDKITDPVILRQFPASTPENVS
ncbi:DUF4132 domain-containing protein [Gluconobacter oxydans]|uniref:DUF4132 domain-containing protein n=1 Tax=Gluconobacter oxydans TaxID=442 RepID=UPI001CD86527|nr:DUF4132 domain-containing protein [Gluconobacter oxydans]